MKNAIGILVFYTLISFTSCKKCESCYLIEEDNGTKVETYLGEFCGDEIENQENKEYVANSPAHAECR